MIQLTKQRSSLKTKTLMDPYNLEEHPSRSLESQWILTSPVPKTGSDFILVFGLTLPSNNPRKTPQHVPFKPLFKVRPTHCTFPLRPPECSLPKVTVKSHPSSPEQPSTFVRLFGKSLRIIGNRKSPCHNPYASPSVTPLPYSF